MRSLSIIMIAVIAPLALAGCGGSSGPLVDVNAVVERTAKTLENFDGYLRRYDYKEVDQAMFQQFNKTYQHELNAAPRFHPVAIATVLRDDASIMAYEDHNANGKADGEEPKLFRLELDADHNRLIITAANGVSSGRSLAGSGFFAGVMIGSLLSRQSTAGITRGHFDQRNVVGAPPTTRVAATQGTVARSSARAGGIRGGK